MVQRFNGTDWEVLGTSGFSDGEAQKISLAIDSTDTPYVAYMDFGHSNKVTIQKWDGFYRQVVGSPGISSGQAQYVSLAIDSTDTPYVAYRDDAHSNQATVMKFNSGTNLREAVGPSQGFSDGRADYISLAIGSGDNPYVAYMDYANDYKATVQKWNGGSWEIV